MLLSTLSENLNQDSMHLIHVMYPVITHSNAMSSLQVPMKNVIQRYVFETIISVYTEYVRQGFKIFAAVFHHFMASD